jgi:hypothetical protein
MASVVYVDIPTALLKLMLTLTAIHGDKQQNERDWVLNEFKTGKSPIMVATDVASRGIGMLANTPLFTLPFLFTSPLSQFVAPFVHICVI